jgi:threonine/homoserine/homoserine lactone efflux protein
MKSDHCRPPEPVFDGDYIGQVIVLGATFMVIGTLSDGAYVVLVGRAGRLMSERRIRLMSRISGVFLIGGGAWLALIRAR